MPIQEASKPNPHRGQDMLITFQVQQDFKGIEGILPIRMRYIPDREILKKEDFSNWLQTISKETWENPEDLAGALMDKFYDTLMPYFVDLRIDITHANGAIQCLETVRQQPQYKMPEHLLRIL